MEKYNNCSPEEENFKVTREFTDGECWSPLFFKTLEEAEKARYDFLFSFISRGVRSVIYKINYMDTHQLYLAFITEYPYISVDESVIENYVKQYPKVTNSSEDLDLLRDYILSKGLEDEIEL